MPSNVQQDTSAAQSDENEIDLNITTPKRPMHEVSCEEEPVLFQPRELPLVP